MRTILKKKINQSNTQSNKQITQKYFRLSQHAMNMTPWFRRLFSHHQYHAFLSLQSSENGRSNLWFSSILFVSPISSPWSWYNRETLVIYLYQVSERYFLTYNGNGIAFTFDKWMITHENLLMFPWNRISCFFPGLDSHEEKRIFWQ